MSIYDELLKLQVIDGAYENWKYYREELTRYIISVTKAGSSAAFFGAGSCNDLDLKELSEHFSQITLVDRERAAMFQALDTYHMSEGEKIKLREADFLGISPNEYREYADDILRMIQVDGKNSDMKEIAEYAILRMKELYQHAAQGKLSFGEKAYDYVVAVGVHSQINNMFAWLWQVYCEAVGQMEESVFEFVKNQNDICIPAFDQALIDCAEKGLILGCEKKRIGMDGGIQGAVQCLRDITRRQEAGEFLIQQSIPLRWPFDVKRQITYEMSVRLISRSTV